MIVPTRYIPSQSSSSTVTGAVRGVSELFDVGSRVLYGLVSFWSFDRPVVRVGSNSSHCYKATDFLLIFYMLLGLNDVFDYERNSTLFELYLTGRLIDLSSCRSRHPSPFPLSAFPLPRLHPSWLDGDQTKHPLLENCPLPCGSVWLVFNSRA